MEAIIFYLFEYGIYLLSFYLLYLLLFKGKNDHQFNRFYLTSSSIICLIIPLLPTNFFVTKEQFFGIILDTIEIGASGTAQIIAQGNESIPLLAIIGSVYIFITVVMAIRFLYGIAKIGSYRNNGTKDVYKNNFIVESEEIRVPFSFFSYIYLPKGIYTKEEKELIVEHEMTHINCGHSLEKVIFLIAKVVFWWHPISHRYFKELELVHEYQVDEKLCASAGKKFYSNFLLTQLNTEAQYSFVNNISSHIKNRIIMISSKNKSTPGLLKWGSYLSLLFAALFLHACHVENDEPLIEDNYKEHKTVTAAVTPEGEFKTVDYIDTVAVFNYETKKEEILIVATEENVYKTPEVMPVFGACGDINNIEEKYECSNLKLLQFIYKNLSYPAAAKESGIEGVNVVSFVITSSGSMRDEKVVRSIGYGTDETILEVLKKMKLEGNLWTPGRHNGEEVATQFMLPIKFKLEG